MTADIWNKAENSIEMQAVIGIVKGEKVLLEELKKCRRVD